MNVDKKVKKMQVNRNENKYPIHIGPVFPCIMCKMCFINVKFLEKHMDKCLKLKIDSFIKNRYILKEKVQKTVTDNKKLIPPKTQLKQMNKKNSQVSQKDTNKSQKNLYECLICKIKCEDSKSLKNHVKSHKINGKFICHICNKSCNRLRDILRHFQLHFTKNAKCKICNKAFSKYDLKNHVKTHSLDKDSKDKIKKKKAPRSRYKDEEVDTIVKRFQCHLCNDNFSCSTSLEAHLHVHSEEKVFTCNICNETFTKTSDYQIHLTIHYFKCVTCDKIFPSSNALKSHLLSHEKNFKCDQCQKHFSKLYLLKVHERIHSNGRQYKCKTCEKTFAQACNLRRHLRTHVN